MPYHLTHALLRRPAPAVVAGLSAAGLSPDFDGVLTEHRAYAGALAAAGVKIELLPALEAFPDGLFVEDPALVFLGPGRLWHGGKRCSPTGASPGRGAVGGACPGAPSHRGAACWPRRVTTSAGVEGTG